MGGGRNGKISVKDNALKIIKLREMAGINEYIQ